MSAFAIFQNNIRRVYSYASIFKPNRHHALPVGISFPGISSGPSPSPGSVMVIKPHRKNRNQAYVRHQNKRVIQRKMNLSQQRGWSVKFGGMFKKGKIHCSCWMCSQKTKHIGYSKSDLAKIVGSCEQLREHGY